MHDTRIPTNNTATSVSARTSASNVPYDGPSVTTRSTNTPLYPIETRKTRSKRKEHPSTDTNSPNRPRKSTNTPTNTSPPHPRTFRVSSIPTNIDKPGLRQYLCDLEYEKGIQPQNSGIQLQNILAFSIAPYIGRLVATITFHQEPLLFLECRPGHPLALQLPQELGGVKITVDCDFYGITPLYHPTSKPKYDLIAVSGLAAHAFGSWKSPHQSHVMWLRDFLPVDFPDIRVFSWGYESSLEDPTATMTIASFSRQLLNAVRTARETGTDYNETRTNIPIIFVGHSLGGLVIKQAVVDAAQGSYEHDKAILASCIGIFLFGVPHRGLNNENLLSLMKEKKSAPFVANLMEGSELLETLHVAFLRSYKAGLEECFIVSFYETKDTKTVTVMPGGGWKRTGRPVRMVSKESAIWSMPNEEVHNQVSISSDHSQLVKFTSRDDHNYVAVRSKIKESVENQSFRDFEQIVRNAVENVQPDQFLRILAEHDQNKHISKIPPMDPNDPQNFWISRNVDFTNWMHADYSHALWISGPTRTEIPRISSYVVDSRKDRGTLPPVLYFFCATAVVPEQHISSVCVQALLSQILVSLTPDNRNQAIALFLNTITNAKIMMETKIATKKQFKHNKPPEVTVRKMLYTSQAKNLWNALFAVLNDRWLELVIIIDGLGQIQDQSRAFTHAVHRFAKRLQAQVRPSKFKMLWTSGTQDEDAIKTLLEGVPWIGYDVERKECLNILRFDNTRYDMIASEHKGSLEWLWSHEQYRRWSSSDTSHLLYLQGKPGSGKSTLTRYFKDHLLEREEAAEHALIASFFYSFREGESQTSHYNMLRSILYDILNQDEGFFYHFQPEHRKYKQVSQERDHVNRTKLHYESLQRILQSIGSHRTNKRLYLIIDAVDESCDDDRRNILKLLFEICSSSCCTIKVFIASRPIGELEHRISTTHAFIRMQDVNRSDIQNYVHSFLGPELHLPPIICHEAAEYLLLHAEGVFLWVRLIRDELVRFVEQGWSKNEIFGFLQGLPTELEEIYGRIFNELKSYNPKMARRVFELVLFARRPLRVLELQHELGISDMHYNSIVPSEKCFEDSLIMGIEKRIIHCGRNLLEWRGLDEPIVQVMHQTVREFFLRVDGPVAMSNLKMKEHDAHARIATSCLQYLIFCATYSGSQLAELPIESWTSMHFQAYIQYLSKRPLICYALCHLQDHLNRCHGAKGIPNLVAVLVQTLTHGNPAFYLLQRWVTSHLKQSLAVNEPSSSAGNFRNTMLLLGAGMGHHRVVEALLIADEIINIEMKDDKMHRSPMHWAAANGHEATVRLLLDRNADIKSRDGDKHWTPLHWAARNGHNATVRQLLDRNADIESIDGNNHCTPLHLAAGNGHDATVQLLLDRKADIESRDGNKNWTPLHWAAANGHDATVRQLLDRRAVIESKDIFDKTALAHAAENGHVTTVGLLLDCGADIEARSSYQCTPLHSAATAEHEATVRLLLDRGADIEARDYGDRRALHYAASGGLEATVRLLLDRGADIKAEGWGGWTALRCAAESGCETIVLLLLDHGSNVNEPRIDNHWTVLHTAILNQHEAVAQLLLDRGADRVDALEEQATIS